MLNKKIQKSYYALVGQKAKTGLKDKLKAMEMGIDDYIVKPFNPLELKARIKMALKPIFQF